MPMHTYPFHHNEPIEPTFHPIYTQSITTPSIKKPACSCKTIANCIPPLFIPKYSTFNTVEELLNHNYEQCFDGCYPYPEPTEHFYFDTTSTEEKINAYDKIFSRVLAANLEIVGRLGTPITKQMYCKAMIAKATTIRYHFKYKNQDNIYGVAPLLKPSFYDFQKNAYAPLLVNDFYAYPTPTNPLVCNDMYNKQFNDVFNYNIFVAAKEFLQRKEYSDIIHEYTSVMNAEKIIMDYYLIRGKQDVNDNMHDNSNDSLCE
jgi:hypothetical protein